jgi:hypothetical protein
MEEANKAGANLGTDYKVAAVSTTSSEWTVAPGIKADGAQLKTSWPVDKYPRTFSITVSLLVVRSEDDIDVIERQTWSLESDISWNGPLKPESAYVRASFNNVDIARLGEFGKLVVRVESVNGIDAETATLNGYIEIIPSRGRTAAVGRRIAERESWRKYWSDHNRLNSVGVAVGTAFYTPTFLVSTKMTFSPFYNGFFEIGSDFGLIHGEKDVHGVEYFSIAPYLHYNFFMTEYLFGEYIGVGGGASFSQYSYPSESHVDPVTVITPTLDVNIGFLLIFDHSSFDLRWTMKTNSKGADHRFTLGYSHRFGYFTKRYGGYPYDLVSKR